MSQGKELVRAQIRVWLMEEVWADDTVFGLVTIELVI